MRFGGNTSYCLTSYRLVNRGPRGNDCINGTVPYITVMIATKPRKTTVWTIWQMQTMRIWLKKVFTPDQWFVVAIYNDTVLTGPYFVTPCEHQCSALHGWPLHSKCSSGLHWHVKEVDSSWFCKKLFPVNRMKVYLWWADFTSNLVLRMSSK